MKKLLAVDLDGTLFYPQRRFALMTRKNLKFLKDFIADGNEVVVATGRNCRMLKKIEKKLGTKLTMIGCKGSFTRTDDKFLASYPLDSKKAASIFVEASNRFGIQAWTLMDDSEYNFIYFNVIPRISTILLKIHYILKFQYKELTNMSKKKFVEKIKNGPVYKLMPVFGLGKKAEARAIEANGPLNEMFSDFAELAISGTVIEITSKGSSKGNALMDYAKSRGYSIDDVYCVGDTSNDISMFKQFPHSFVMAHSPKWVKDHACHEVNRVSDIRKYIDNSNLTEGDMNFFLKHKDDPIKPR